MKREREIVCTVVMYCISLSSFLSLLALLLLLPPALSSSLSPLALLFSTLYSVLHFAFFFGVFISCLFPPNFSHMPYVTVDSGVQCIQYRVQ